MRALLVCFLVLVPVIIVARKQTKTVSKKAVKLDPIRLQEAKMVDIPIPLSSIAVPNYSDESDQLQILSYKDKKLSLDQIKMFYASEMERLGWMTKEQFHGKNESLLRFKKPHRTCVISIRSIDQKGPVHIVIFSGSRES